MHKLHSRWRVCRYVVNVGFRLSIPPHQFAGHVATFPLSYWPLLWMLYCLFYIRGKAANVLIWIVLLWWGERHARPVIIALVLWPLAWVALLLMR